MVFFAFSIHEVLIYVPSSGRLRYLVCFSQLRCSLGVHIDFVWMQFRKVITFYSTILSIVRRDPSKPWDPATNTWLNRKLSML